MRSALVCGSHYTACSGIAVNFGIQAESSAKPALKPTADLHNRSMLAQWFGLLQQIFDVVDHFLPAVGRDFDNTRVHANRVFRTSFHTKATKDADA